MDDDKDFTDALTKALPTKLPKTAPSGPLTIYEPAREPKIPQKGSPDGR